MEIMDASIVGLITSAVCIFLLWKFLSCAVFPLLGNIILGGLLYTSSIYCILSICRGAFLTLSLLLSSEFREPFSLRFSIFSSNNRSRCEKIVSSFRGYDFSTPRFSNFLFYQ